MIKTQYITSDGTQFEYYQDAVDHESANNDLMKHIKEHINAEYSDDVGFDIITHEDVGAYIINYWDDITDLIVREEF